MWSSKETHRSFIANVLLLKTGHLFMYHKFMVDVARINVFKLSVDLSLACSQLWLWLIFPSP